MKFIQIKGYNDDIRINPKYIYATTKILNGYADYYYKIITITGAEYPSKYFKTQGEALLDRTELENNLIDENHNL